MHYVVAGTGYTGSRVLQHLRGASGISRSRRPGIGDRELHIRDFDARMEPIQFPGSYALLYTAPPARGAPDDTRLRNLLSALSPAPSRIVYLSTSAVYGNRSGALVDESALAAPGHARSKRRFRNEQSLLEFGIANGSDIVLLRVPAIYGPHRMGIGRIESAAPLLVEADSKPGNRIHVADLVQCCVSALNEETPSGVYNVSDGDYRSATWFSTRVAELAGMQPRPGIPLDEAKHMFSPVQMSFLEESRRLDNTRMREVLGIKLRYPDPEDGIRDSLLEQGRLVA